MSLVRLVYPHDVKKVVNEIIDEVNGTNLKYESSIKPTLDLDFANNSYSIYDSFENSFVKKPLADILTFTRGTVANGVNALGKLSEAAIDKPRLVFDGETGEAEGLLVEESSTNLLINTTTLAGWVSADKVEVTDSGIASPIDGLNWLRLTEIVTDKTEFYRDQFVSVTAGTYYTVSCYVGEQTGGRTFSLRLPTLIQGTSTSIMDPSTGVILVHPNTTSGATARVERVTGGWRFIMENCLASTTGTAIIRLQLRVGNSTTTHAGAGLSVLCTAPQFEPKPYATSYIKTEASQITRINDNAVRTLGSEFNSDEWTVFVAMNDVGGGNFPRVFSFFTDSSNRIFLRKTSATSDKSTSYELYAVIDGVLYDDTNFAAPNDKFVVTYSNGLVSVYSVNGFEQSLSVICPAFEKFYIGGEATPTATLTACFNRVSIYPRALSPTDCIKLTKL